MKDIRLDNVEEPKVRELTDAIVRLTSGAICRAHHAAPGDVRLLSG